VSTTRISFEELETAATQQTTVNSADTTAAKSDTKTETTAVATETKPQFTETDVEAYKQLVDMGITPQNAAEFKAAKQALENLPLLLKNNPDLLLDEIEKNDPELHKQLLEKVSDRWFNRLPPDVREGKSNGNGSESRTVSSATNPVIERLERQVNALVQERTQEKTEAQQKTILSGLNTAFENLVAKLPAGVSERDKDYIRLKAERLLWSDATAAKRINQGVYVDVPTYFSKAASLVTAETKAAATAANDKRAGVEARGERTIPNAAENVNGTTSEPEGHGKDRIWGDLTPEEKTALRAYSK
jgi:hypothetical protein